ncbi:MAG: TlpA family protein disulfide reductase [Campylobacterales bacterium]|nr:TlpA family protein disulfide reductase [Campylobacterales bacterium]
MKLLANMTIAFILLFTSSALCAENDETFTIKDVEGKSYTVKGIEDGLDFSDFKGKIIFLDFFGHQCPPCLASIDTYKKIQEKYKDEIVVIGLEVQGLNSEELKEFGKSKEINYMLVSQDQAYDFLNYITVRAEWTGAIPFLLIVDEKGIVQLMHLGMIEEETFEKIITELKKGKKTTAS